MILYAGLHTNLFFFFRMPYRVPILCNFVVFLGARSQILGSQKLINKEITVKLIFCKIEVWIKWIFLHSLIIEKSKTHQPNFA